MWNVCSISHKDDQLEDKLIKENIYIAVISETIRKQKYMKPIIVHKFMEGYKQIENHKLK